LRYPKYKYFILGLDLLALLLTFLSARIIYNAAHSQYILSFSDFSLNDLLLGIFANSLLIFIFHYNNLYKMNLFLSRALQLSIIIKSMLYGIFFLIILFFFLNSKFYSDSRLFLILYFVCLIFWFILIRVFFIQIIYAKHLSNSIFKRNLLIIGAGKSGVLFAQKMLMENSYGVKIIGFVDDNIEIGSKVFRHLKVLGNTDEFGKIAKQTIFDEIVICIDKINYQNLLEIIDKCNKTNATVKVTSELFQIIPDKLFSEEYSDVPVIDVSKKLNIKIYNIAKRIIDFTGAFIGIILLSPFIVLTSISIKLSSKGPIIYKQLRIGKNGKPFHIYKFRTMTILDEEDKMRKELMIEYIKGRPSLGKIVNHQRITRIGSFLRKYSLDELPQFFNVILGDMSLVGPRPCLPYEYEHYDEWQKRRLSVLPGCTGLWQVSGRNNVNFNDSIVMDLYYINNISPWLDLQLIFRTLPVMVFARGGK
jgi:exopolysaccharide biosynthesis polyprenyl glycosylphosphotransferase